MTPAEPIRSYLQRLDAKQLADKFGIGINATEIEFADEDCALQPEIAMAVHGELIQSWSAETPRTNKARAKAYKFFTGRKGEV